MIQIRSATRVCSVCTKECRLRLLDGLARFCVAACLLILAGCREPEVVPVPHYPRFTKDEVLTELNRRASLVTTVKAKGKLRYKAADMRSAEECDMSVALQKPNRLRLRGTYYIALKPQLVLDMGSDGTSYWLYLHTREVHEVRIGSLSNLEKRPGKGFLTPRMLLVGLGLEEAPHERAGDYLVCTGFPQRYLLDHILRREGRLLKKSTLWVERKDLTLSRYQLFDKAGYILLEVKLQGYKEVEGIPIAHEITMCWPADGTLFGLKLENVKLNLPLEDKLWKFKMPEGVRVINEDLQYSPGDPFL